EQHLQEARAQSSAGANNVDIRALQLADSGVHKHTANHHTPVQQHSKHGTPDAKTPAPVALPRSHTTTSWPAVPRAGKHGDRVTLTLEAPPPGRSALAQPGPTSRVLRR